MRFERANVLAVSSSGGHWEQLLLASAGCAKDDILFVVTKAELPVQAGLARSRVVGDCNRDQPLQLLKCILQCVGIVISTRPKVVISTGAAPGLICIVLGRLVGARTIWIDSVANVEKMSLSGKMAGYVANIWLTQWEHLSSSEGPRFEGQVL